MQGAKHLLLNAVFTSREQAFCGKRFKTFDHHATAHFYRRHLAHRTGAIAGIQPSLCRRGAIASACGPPINNGVCNRAGGTGAITATSM